MIEGVLTKIRRKLHDRIVYNFHVSSPKKNQDIQMYGHKVKFMDKISGCYPINNSFEINFKFLNICFMHLLFKFDIHFYEFFVCSFYEIHHVCTILTISCNYIWLSCILDILYESLFSQERWECGGTFKFCISHA